MKIEDYIGLSQLKKKEFCIELENNNPEFSLKSLSGKSPYHLPIFVLKNTGIEFCYIPETITKIGFDEEDEKNAIKIIDPLPLDLQELRPSFSEKINPFFVSRKPFTNQNAYEIGLLNKQKIDLSMPYFTKFDNAHKIAGIYNLSLPSEYQWECFCRGMTTSLFCFGNKVPSTKQLEKWLNWNLDNEEELNTNSFDMLGLFFGEWCIDDYKKSHKKTEKSLKSKVIKGGGAYFWPWQEQEWIWCLSSIRFPSSELIDKKAVFRLVKNL